MTRVQETIPEGLKPQVDAALRWFNQREDVTFEATGIVDPDEALAMCEFAIHIPIGGPLKSLNVSHALAIAMFEATYRSG